MTTAILLSGGVDSSVALLRLLGAGRPDLTAFFLKVWLEEEVAGFGDCPWEEDLAHARAVCDLLGVPLEVVPLQREYRERIVAYALDELGAGRTPSPDVLCNRRIKLGAFLEAVGEGFGEVASGHYARVVERDGRRWLARAADPVKDQTYFLSQLTPGQLARCRFPLGDLTKSEVRRIAAERGLPTARRPDSQGLCFLGEIPFDRFVRCHLGERPGAIRELGTGRRLGEHRGHWFYTLGQRKGLGLSGGPWFVVAKDVAEDVVWVTHGDGLGEAASDRFTVPAPHWITAAPDLASSRQLRVKVRHGPSSYACRLEPVVAGGLAVTLERPDPGLAPGQFAVFYDGELCVGGGAMEVVPTATRANIGA
jgi:tRNA-specific 2-thiouridylase